MSLPNILISKKENIIKEWFDQILKDYPKETSHFLKTQKDSFSNPVGHVTLSAIERLFDGLINKVPLQNHSPYLTDIIKIRALQEFTPSQAIGFIFLLKNIINIELNTLSDKENLLTELLEFESQIDNISLLAFDIYMECREKLFEINSNQVKDRMFRLLQRANILVEKEAGIRAN